MATSVVQVGSAVVHPPPRNEKREHDRSWSERRYACVKCGKPTRFQSVGAGGRLYSLCGCCVAYNRHGDSYGRSILAEPRAVAEMRQMQEISEWP